MNKIKLAEELDLSLVTISRYMVMGMPYEKVKGKYHFDISEVQDWINDHIHRRTPGQNEHKPSVKEIASWGLDMSSALITFIEKQACGKCREKFMSHVENGKFHL